MKTAVFGSGAWGTALAAVLAWNGHETVLWSHRKETAERLRTTRENPRLPGVSLPESLQYAGAEELPEAADLAVIAAPSYAFRETARKVREIQKHGCIAVSVSKGIERETGLRFTEVMREELGEIPCAVLSGPSHAEEVGRGIPTGVVAASEDIRVAETVQNAFMNSRFRVYTSTDPVGVEISGALKNVIALAAGISDGLGFGDNTKALLMTRGLTEIARLAIRLGGSRDTVAGLAGAGDLIVTCTSMHSRNRRAGILIGQGKTPEEAMREVGAVVEGYYATASAAALAAKTGTEMPITEQACAVLYGGRPVRDVPDCLMNRARKNEQESTRWF